MKSKLIKFIISTLLIILTITSVFTLNKYQDNMNKAKQIISSKPQVEQTFRVIDKQTVIDKLNLENSLNCLSGEAQVQATYSNKKISDQDVNMRYLKDWFNNSTSKDISVNSTYKFLFSYQLKDLPISIYNNTINIQLSYNRLSLQSLELTNTDSKERLGWLEPQFTPNQIAGIQERVKQEARNTIQSNEDYRYKAMENIQGDIKDLLQSVVGKDTNIHFEVLENSNVIQQNDVSIIK
jgi:hypothetical protein